MDTIKSFFELSSIHGLVYISTTTRLVRLAWIFVVILGVTGAGFMIYQSFQAWDESPITTTIENHPISKITFPKLTVCPPKKTFTNLNYDLKKMKNITLDNATRSELLNYAESLLSSNLDDNTLKKNLSMLTVKNMYYNWYHGLTKIQIPKPIKGYDISYDFSTCMTSGTIHTPFFGEKFNADKIETDIQYNINIHIPISIVEFTDKKINIDIKIRKISMKVSNGQDEMHINDEVVNDTTTTILKRYHCANSRVIKIVLKRKVNLDEINEQKLESMPGFNVTWYYSVRDYANGYDKSSGYWWYSLKEFNEYYKGYNEAFSNVGRDPKDNKCKNHTLTLLFSRYAPFPLVDLVF